MKNKAFKKLTAVLLTLSLLFTFVPVSSVFAEENGIDIEPDSVFSTPEPVAEEIINDTEPIENEINATENLNDSSENIEDVFDESITMEFPDNSDQTEKTKYIVDTLPRYGMALNSNSTSSYDTTTLYNIEMEKFNKYNKNISGELSVNSVSGSVSYMYNIASVPGKNGSNMSLDLVYNSSKSQFVYAGADIEDAADYYTVPYTYYASGDSIGAGWEFSMLNRMNGTDWYYTLKDGQVVSIFDTPKYDYYTITSSANETIISYIDGTKECINDEGYLKYVEDKYGNRITYTYETFTDYYNQDDLRLKTITDNQNRSITVNYYDSYIEVTKPDNTKIRLYIENVTAENVGAAHGFDMTFDGKTVSRIVDTSTNEVISSFSYQPIEYRFFVGPVGVGIQSDDYGVFMAMTEMEDSYNNITKVDYIDVSNMTSDPFLQAPETRRWYLCADKYYRGDVLTPHSIHIHISMNMYRMIEMK